MKTGVHAKVSYTNVAILRPRDIATLKTLDLPSDSATVDYSSEQSDLDKSWSFRHSNSFGYRNSMLKQLLFPQRRSELQTWRPLKMPAP